MSNYIIDEIQPTAWRLRIRDESTGKTEEVALRPGEPWKVRVGGTAKPKPEPPDKRPAAEKSKPEPVPTPAEPPAKSTEPLPKDLKLALENGSGNTVVATAHGRSAAAWAKTQRRLLGRKWDETAEGNPFVMLRNSPTLLEDLERALPGIRLDTKHFTPPEAPAAKETKETKKSEEPEEAKRAEKPATEETKIVETPAAKKTKKPTHADKPARKGKNAGKPPKLQPGAGPGGLEWTETRDAGNRAIVAPWQEGHFKILRAGSGVYALFYEYERGGYEQLACGKPDDLKQVASARTSSGKGQRVTEALARGACNTCAPAPAEPAANESPKRSPRASVRAAEPSPEPTPAQDPVPVPAPAPAEPTPPTSDASRDAELMSGFRKELAGIFDEDDE